jgi:hypothetical protein
MDFYSVLMCKLSCSVRVTLAINHIATATKCSLR